MSESLECSADETCFTQINAYKALKLQGDWYELLSFNMLFSSGMWYFFYPFWNVSERAEVLLDGIFQAKGRILMGWDSTTKCPLDWIRRAERSCNLFIGGIRIQLRMECISLPCVSDRNILPQQQIIQSGVNRINMNLKKIGKLHLENVFQRELHNSILG